MSSTWLTPAAAAVGVHYKTVRRRARIVALVNFRRLEAANA